MLNIDKAVVAVFATASFRCGEPKFGYIATLMFFDIDKFHKSPHIRLKSD